MSFRRTRPDFDHHSDWSSWRERHASTLASIGLPPSLYADEQCWHDLLENGHLHWHEDPWQFEFGQLSVGQLAALHRFLEGEYGEADVCPPLLAWVRVRVEGR